MPTTLALENLPVTLSELLNRLAPGEELILTRDRMPVARLVSEPASAARHRPPPGLGKGMVTFLAPDFDAPLDDWQEYTE